MAEQGADASKALAQVLMAEMRQELAKHSKELSESLLAAFSSELLKFQRQLVASMHTSRGSGACSNATTDSEDKAHLQPRMRGTFSLPGQLDGDSRDSREASPVRQQGASPQRLRETAHAVAVRRAASSPQCRADTEMETLPKLLSTSPLPKAEKAKSQSPRSTTEEEQAVDTCETIVSPQSSVRESPQQKTGKDYSLLFGRSSFSSKRRVAKRYSRAAFYHSTEHVSSVQRKLLRAKETMEETGLLKKKTDHLGYQQLVLRVVTTNYFDLCVGGILVLNAVVMGLEAEMRSQSVDSGASFDVMSAIFTATFAIELLLRIVAYGAYFFKHPDDWCWNLFDTGLVLMLMMDEVIKHVDANPGSAMFATIKMLRLGRVIRMVRLIRLIPDLKQLVALLTVSMTSFFWTAVLQFMVMYCFALYFMNQTVDFVASNEGTTAAAEVQASWGSLPAAVLSLFMAMTGGDDWKNFIAILNDDSVLNGVVFYLYITFATLVMLNLVTGVFVDSAQQLISKDRDKEMIKLAASCFAEIDADNSGQISMDEFVDSLHWGAMLTFCNEAGLVPEEAVKLFKMLDTDKSGELSISEFVEGCLRLRAPARALDLTGVVLSVRVLTDMCEQEFKKVRDMVRASAGEAN
eukprot:TRINITY_DN7075_c0_g1_i1.p1 TRINITY_DN7075_c0_g1~~TRINITY_DN7075_c0_g1_i1.p1  ORF type:complete len:634 (-),score=147.46 TRINITY_DN7075_c0_g1_i1:11-1912(-)